MPNPFDTGIRLTVSPDPARVRCDVDEFVLCPSNTRADEAITARDEWKRQAESEARDHLVTRRQLVEAEVALAQAERERDEASARCVNDDLTLDMNQRAVHAIGKRCNEALDEACERVVAERDAAVQRAEQAEHLHAEAESDLARLSVRLVEAEARDAEARRVWQAEGKAPAGICPHCGSTISVVQRDGWFRARCAHRGCGASGPQHSSLTRAVDWFCRRGKAAP